MLSRVSSRNCAGLLSRYSVVVEHDLLIVKKEGDNLTKSF